MTLSVLPGVTDGRTNPSPEAGIVGRVLAFLPAGGNLPYPDFKRRHRAIVYLIWIQAAGTLVFGLAKGVYPPVVVAEVTPAIAHTPPSERNRGPPESPEQTPLLVLLTVEASSVAKYSFPLESRRNVCAAG